MGLSSEDTALGTKVSLHETAAKKKDTEDNQAAVMIMADLLCHQRPSKDLDEEEPGLSTSMLQKLLRWSPAQMSWQLGCYLLSSRALKGTRLKTHCVFIRLESL